MASPNISEIATVSIESRRGALADNMTKNTALLARLKQRGRIKPVTGGTTILEELNYAENATYTRFSGYEILNIQPSDVFTAAEYDLRQSSVAVSISGLQQLQNAGKERMIDLLEGRIANAEASMVNGLSGDLYSDGTADGGKQVDGVQSAISNSPATGTYGGINRANHAFWRNQRVTGTTSANIRSKMMALWMATCRNMDKVDLIAADNNFYGHYWAALQDQQRFTNPAMGRMGFTNLKFDSADVILDGGIGGSAPANRMFFINTKYLHWRPHIDQDMVPSDERFATNQHAMVKLILWAGNLTTSNAKLQGLLTA